MKEHMILEDRCYKGMVTLTYGPSGSGKSLLSLLEGMAISSGKTELLNGQNIKKSKVLLVTSPGTLPDYILNTRIDAVSRVYRTRHPKAMDITDSWPSFPDILKEQYDLVIVDDYEASSRDVEQLYTPELAPTYPIRQIVEKGMLDVFKQYALEYEIAVMINSASYVPGAQIEFETIKVSSEISELHMRKNNFVFTWVMPKQVHKVCVSLSGRQEGCLALFR